MKRLAIFLLLGAFAATHLASAEDNKHEKKQAKHNAQVARKVANAQQPRQLHRANNQRVNPHLNQNLAARSKFVAPVNNQARFNRSHHITPNVTVAHADDNNRILRNRGANPERLLTIPMRGTRSLNLATAVAIVLFEAVRQKATGFGFEPGS